MRKSLCLVKRKYIENVKFLVLQYPPKCMSSYWVVGVMTKVYTFQLRVGVRFLVWDEVFELIDKPYSLHSQLSDRTFTSSNFNHFNKFWWLTTSSKRRRVSIPADLVSILNIWRLLTQGEFIWDHLSQWCTTFTYVKRYFTLNGNNYEVTLEEGLNFIVW